MIRVAKQLGWVTWVFVTRDALGNPVSPVATPVVRIYRVDPSSGGLAPDLNITPTGTMSVTAVAGAPAGTWAATAKFDTALFEQYWLLGQYQIGLVQQCLPECLVLSNADQQILDTYRVDSGTTSTQLFPLTSIPGGGV